MNLLDVFFGKLGYAKSDRRFKRPLWFALNEQSAVLGSFDNATNQPAVFFFATRFDAEEFIRGRQIDGNWNLVPITSVNQFAHFDQTYGRQFAHYRLNPPPIQVGDDQNIRIYPYQELRQQVYG